ncbi:hypothetical protein G7B40_024170 [Aetokthonos hydrillicola Thurmond2011]|jgi:hypothetical protein|uniref:Uncharacterized protein n=1 Tax=Aetokthonos hydrillicola Thurmond2011 TaxID=2712845 RepID=A0AAP5I9Z7_9CYAN|nr:hypothetical protein [Aetokthonos hydrillicola]MBO3461116.1 hypothetical protein [Aetokthonos hydrillicola CCALA 1050]MBW4586885.1 hypothetical protein [Aetokthonos hydrillicola CCALA 1050]MDR9897640.1 hypothetical protein [Aetokthonos hydrillicola Thurmond2011]
MHLIKFFRLSAFSPKALVASAFGLSISVLIILLFAPLAEEEIVDYGAAAEVQDAVISPNPQILNPINFELNLVSSLYTAIVGTLAIFCMQAIEKMFPSPYSK